MLSHKDSARESNTVLKVKPAEDIHYGNSRLLFACFQLAPGGIKGSFNSFLWYLCDQTIKERGMERRKVKSSANNFLLGVTHNLPFLKLPCQWVVEPSACEVELRSPCLLFNMSREVQPDSPEMGFQCQLHFSSRGCHRPDRRGESASSSSPDEGGAPMPRKNPSGFPQDKHSEERRSKGRGQNKRMSN